jgi:Yip1-like protein
MREFLFRIIGAATLNPGVYEDVEADPKATAQAVGVIALASLAAGVGANGWNAQPRSILAFSAVAGFLGLLAWASWALVTFEIGGRLLPTRETKVDVPQLLRTIGFSAAPALFLVMGAFGATTLVFAITSVWMLAAMVLAVRQALDYESTARALAVCALGWLLTAVFVIAIGLFYGPGLAA